MNIKLAELIDSIPPYYVKTQYPGSAAYQYNNYSISIGWYLNGEPSSYVYRQNGELHRPYTEGPAYQDWHPNGQPWEISYYENGNLHRPSEDGPATQTWNANGQPLETITGLDDDEPPATI